VIDPLWTDCNARHTLGKDTYGSSPKLGSMTEPSADQGAVLGFHSITEERTESLSVEGDLPEWLSGRLIRNGPGSFAVGDSSVDHWFDGLAMLQQYTFDGDDAVHYRNRFLRTDAYERAQNGQFDGGFATGESTLRERLYNAALAAPYDNTNIIVERFGDEYVALTESPRWVGVDPDTLETTGHVQYDGPVPAGQLACAHLQYDPETGTYVNFEIEFGRQSQYHVYEMHTPRRRKLLASIPTDRPAYMHSFALTPNYVVLSEFPFDVNPLSFLKPGRQGPFIQNFEWRPSRGTRFHVVDRVGGGVVGTARAPAMFGFHHVNAYEADGDIVLDLETVPDATAIATLSLADLRAGNLDVLGGKLDRFRIADPEGRCAVTRRELYEGGTALPTVSPAVWLDDHRYVYAQGTDQPVTEWARAVVKVDTETGAVTEFTDDESYFSEPIFVPRPDAEREDDGVVLTVLLDRDAERSVLVVLDGETFTERARALLPHALPFDFHGRFFPA
jgi:carotenoid cleavage dioxygenase-like enzyme